MKTFNLLLLFIFVISFNAFNQIWLAGSEGNQHSESFDVKKDQLGNTYVTGYITGSTKIKTITVSSVNGYSDVFIAKFNSAGVIQWVKTFGGTLADRGLKMAVDPSNNIFLTGYFHGSMTMGGVTLQSNSNSRDFFLAKLNSSGDVIWAKAEGGSLGETAYDVASDNQGNCIVTGQFEGNTTIGNYSTTSTLNPETNILSFDLFVAKYTSNGDPLWVKTGQAEYEDRGIALVCDINNDIYLTGQFSDTLTFMGQTINNQIYNAGFVAKISSGGSLAWLRRIAASQALAYDIEINTNQELYVTGDFLGNMMYWDNTGFHSVTNPYSKKIFLLKINNQQGSFIWGKAQGSESEVSSRSLCIDDAQNIYLGGYFKCNFDEYRDSSATGLWNSLGFRDAYVSKFSPSGNMLWNKHMGGQREDQIYALTKGTNDRPIFTGSFEQSIFMPFALVTNYAYQDIIYGVCEYLVVGGDLTKNVFVGNTLDASSDSLYYYSDPDSFDYVEPSILPDVDTFEFCEPNSVFYDLGFMNYCGIYPEYEVVWNNGTQGQSSTSPFSTLLVAQYLRTDLCDSHSDSIFVIPHEVPEMPLLTDDKSVNFQSIHYGDVYLCYPDSVLFHFSNLCTGCSMAVYDQTGALIQTDTSEFQISETTQINVGVTSEFGCTNGDNFYVSIDNTVTSIIDSINPGLVLLDYVDYNDSVTVCHGENVFVMAIDLNTNPNQNFTPFTNPFLSESFEGIGFGISSALDDHTAYFTPYSSGWYPVNYTINFGTVSCQGDSIYSYSVIDSFYVEVNVLPSIDVDVYSSDQFFCANDDYFIWTDSIVQNFTWNGEGIVWTSIGGDSIQVNQSGYYSYSGTITDPQTGCSTGGSGSILVNQAPNPTAFTNPSDGIVCPFDSVYLYLSVTSGLGTFSWFGPQGNEISTAQGVYVTEQGFYHCVYTNPQGCEFTTNQVEVKEYMTPFVEVSPSNDLCNGPVTINAIFGGSATVLWNPIGSGNSIIVSQPGIYSAQISQCGFTAYDSVIIVNNSFIASLTASHLTTCFNEPSILTTNPNMAAYQWNGPNQNSLTNVLSTNLAGNYSVTVTNHQGCTSTSPTISLTTAPESTPTNVGDQQVCYNGTVTLQTGLNLPATWYLDTAATQPIYQGQVLTLSNIQNDTVVYVAYNNSVCPLVIEAVSIFVNNQLEVPAIIIDDTLCANIPILVQIAEPQTGSYTWTFEGSQISTQNSVVLESVQNGDTLFLTNSNFCSSVDTFVVFQNLITSPTFALDLDSLILCYQNELNLTYTFDSIFNGNVNWIYQTDTLTSSQFNAIFGQHTGYIIAYGTDQYGCNTNSDTVFLVTSDLLPPPINSISSWCLNDSIILNINPQSSYFYWVTPNGDTINMTNQIYLTLDTLASTWAYLISEDNLGCIITDSIELAPFGLPIFNIPDTATCFYFDLVLNAPNSSWTYNWSNGTSSLNFTADSSGLYSVTAIDVNGCTFTDTFNIEILGCESEAPNVITSNNDGINDFFIIPNAEFMFGNHIIIQNRWGNIVFEESDYKNTFNGEGLTEGAYYYMFFPKGLKYPTNKIDGYFHIFH